MTSDYIVPLAAPGISSLAGLLFLANTAYYTPNSRHYLILATHLWTFVSQLISFFAVFMRYVNHDYIIGNKLGNFGDILINMQFLLMALLNAYILQIFSVLDSRITKNRLRILRAFLVLSYIMLSSLKLVSHGYQMVLDKAFPFVEIPDKLARVIPVIGILYETVQSVYLVNLIHQLRKKTLDRKDLNAALIFIVALRILDCSGVILVFVLGDFTIPDAYIGIHSCALAYLFSLLKNLALTRKQKNAHKKMPKTVKAPAQIQQTEPAVQKEISTEKELLESKKTEQLESKKTEIIARL